MDHVRVSEPVAERLGEPLEVAEHVGEQLDPYSTIARHAQTLLDGPADLSAYDVARRADVSVAKVLEYWRAMGFQGVRADARVFAASDAEALIASRALVTDLGVDEQTWRRMIRAAAHSSDRLGLWQLENLVEDAERRLHLDDTSARLVVLDRIAEVVDALAEISAHTWRRHLVALLVRTERAVGKIGHPDTDDALPLERAIGFVDVVAYTERTARLGAHDLSALVATFEERSRDLVTGSGARVVKTLGDGVLFVADDLGTGIDVALDLVAGFHDGAVPLVVHGAVTWGRVLSRSGDVFGPTVNLASRLADLAEPGEILTDSVTWQFAEATGAASAILAVAQCPADAPGIGSVEPVLLRRRAA